MKDQKENTFKKYGLVELATGKYFDKKLKKNLILKTNYVEMSGDEFKKNAVAMILYCYEDGKDRTDTSENFVIYGEAFLEPIGLDQDKQTSFDEAIETESKEVLRDGPVPLVGN